jgi:murein L,D-transpeptidase YafK
MEIKIIKDFLFLLLSLSFMFIFSCKWESDEKLPAHLFENSSARFAIVITKKDFNLSVYDMNLKRVASYKIGYGSNPDMKAKLHQGDNRTPEGFYRINEILSMDAEKGTLSYKKLKSMNELYFSSKAGYHKFGDTDTDLGDNVYGPRFFSIDYPNMEDKEKYSEELEKGGIPLVKGAPAGIGYGIGIHGNNDEDSIGNLCSSGCIRMFNRDIVEMDRFIEVGTPVLIR